LGRLFWKFFLTLFIAQIVTTIVIGTLFWFLVPGHDHPQLQRPPEMTMPGPGFGGNPPPGLPLRPERRREFPLLPIGVGLLASLVFAFLLARHLAKPILGLRTAFREVARGNFDVSLTAEMGSRKDELADLGRDFDSTAKQLKQLIDSQRRLLHDVSHEVRSPLARMQLAIDLARQQPEKVESAIERIERESGRIDRLMEELLTLSRLEAGAYGALEDPVDIVELISEIVEDAQFEAQAKGCRVELTSLPHVVVEGRVELLQRAIENVIRNALKHTRRDSQVGVAVTKEGSLLVIRISDEGPGLPASALGTIFEPFVRVHEDRGNDGYGLGLAITREVVEAHRGSIRAMNRNSGGLCVEIGLPLQSSAAGSTD
jgi:two-component system OmpR family sensor kinase